MWGRYANAAARLESGLSDMAYCHYELVAPSYRNFRVIYVDGVQIRVWSRPRVVSNYEATAIVSLTREGKLSKSAVDDLGDITRILCRSWSAWRTRAVWYLVWIVDCGVDSNGMSVAMPVWVTQGPYEERSFDVIVDVSFGLLRCSFFSSYRLKLCSGRRNCVDWRNVYLWSENDRYIIRAPYRLVNYRVCRRDVCASLRYGSTCY